MSHLLAEWLNQKGFFDKKIVPETMDSQFQTGYLFGVMLDKFGFEENFTKNYVNSDASDAIIKNFISLEHCLRDRLKINFTSQQALDLIKMKPGSCARLLYEIKVVTDGQRTNIKEEKSVLTPLKRFESYPSSPVGINLITRRREHEYQYILCVSNFFL